MSIQTSVEEILEDIKKYSPYPEKVKLLLQNILQLKI